MKTFYAEIHSHSSEADKVFEVQARDLQEAMLAFAAFVAGAMCYGNVRLELRSVGLTKKRGAKTEVLL